MKLLTSFLFVVTFIIFQLPTSAVAQNTPKTQTVHPLVTPTGNVMLQMDTLFCGPCTFFIPRFFSPTIDQREGGWRVRPLCDHAIESFNLEVFNRWGESFFKTNDISEYWNGQADIEFVQPGFYVYKISIEIQSDDQSIPAERTGRIKVIPPTSN